LIEHSYHLVFESKEFDGPNESIWNFFVYKKRILFVNDTSNSNKSNTLESTKKEIRNKNNLIKLNKLLHKNKQNM